MLSSVFVYILLAPLYIRRNINFFINTSSFRVERSRCREQRPSMSSVRPRMACCSALTWQREGGTYQRWTGLYSTTRRRTQGIDTTYPSQKFILVLILTQLWWSCLKIFWIKTLSKVICKFAWDIFSIWNAHTFFYLKEIIIYDNYSKFLWARGVCFTSKPFWTVVWKQMVHSFKLRILGIPCKGNGMIVRSEKKSARLETIYLLLKYLNYFQLNRCSSYVLGFLALIVIQLKYRAIV